MNPSTIRNQSQLMKVREAYLANLELEQKNLQKTVDAVSILKQTGQPPLAPQDTRSLNEKLGDIEKLKITLRKQLMTITDGQQTAEIMNALSNDEIQALGIAFGDVAAQLQPKYVNGVPAPVFLEYVRRFLKNYSKNVGLASGNQNQPAEELELTRDMLQRVLPSEAIMQELMRSIDAAPDSRGKEAARTAVRELADSLPKIADILAAQNILSENELATLSTLITNALQEVPSASQIQKLSKDIINALRSGSKSESDDIIKKTLNAVKLGNAEMQRLKEISTAMEREQTETARQAQNITTPSPVTATQIDEVARIMNSTLRDVQVRTGEKRINRAGKEVFVTVPARQLVAKRTITERDRNIANDVFLIDRLTAEELVAPIGDGGRSAIEKINKPALVGYWDYLSKRDRGVGLTFEEITSLEALNKEQLRKRVIDFKGGEELGALAPRVVKKEAAAAKQQTAVDIGGVSASAAQQQQQPKATLNIEQKAIYDYSQSKLMEMIDFAALDDVVVQLEYLGYLLALGAFDSDLSLKADVEDLVARDPTSLKTMTVRGVYDRVKRVTGMGMKKKVIHRSKAQNIVFGCGLAKSVSRPKKEFSEKIDFSEGLPKDKSYIPFGKYVIHKHKLTGGILQVRTIKGGAIPKLPTLGISPSLGKIIKKMVGGGLPTYDEMSALNEDEKNTLYKVFKLSQIDKVDMLPSPDKTKEEQEMNRFQILKGQIQAGNDNAELIKEFKCMLMRFISGGKIPRGQGMDIVCELMSLGY